MLQVILTDQNYALAASLAARDHQSVSAWLNKMIESAATTVPVELLDRPKTSQMLEQLERRLG